MDREQFDQMLDAHKDLEDVTYAAIIETILNFYRDLEKRNAEPALCHTLGCALLCRALATFTFLCHKPDEYTRPNPFEKINETHFTIIEEFERALVKGFLEGR